MGRALRENGKLMLSEVIAESMWRTLGWVCEKQSNVVLETMQHVFACDDGPKQALNIEAPMEMARS